MQKKFIGLIFMIVFIMVIMKLRVDPINGLWMKHKYSNYMIMDYLPKKSHMP